MITAPTLPTPTLPTLEEFFVAHGAATRAPRQVLPFHRRIFRALTRWVTSSLPGGRRNLAVCMPPRHGKTFIARDLVAWGLGAWPDSEWIYTSCSAQLAVAQTVAIRAAVSSDWYRAAFPWVGVLPGKAAGLVRHTGGRGRVRRGRGRHHHRLWRGQETP